MKRLWEQLFNISNNAGKPINNVITAEAKRAGSNFTCPVTGMEFVFVKGGTFRMGDIFGDGFNGERPEHNVKLGDFLICKHPVTRIVWKMVMGEIPSNFTLQHIEFSEQHPVININWDSAHDFIKKLNQLTGKHYRLPTEAEWEYAARSGGKKEKWSGTSDKQVLGEYAWYKNNSCEPSFPVGQKLPNCLGIYDMSGNVWELVNDWYAYDYYNKSPEFNPQGPSSGTYRVARGGSWSHDPSLLRTANRGRVGLDVRPDFLGIRLVLPQG